MKTIAAAAVLMMLAVPAWADEPAKNEATGPANANEPIVLSEAEMDEVVAGTAGPVPVPYPSFSSTNSHSSSSTTGDGWLGTAHILPYIEQGN